MGAGAPGPLPVWIPVRVGSGLMFGSEDDVREASHEFLAGFVVWLGFQRRKDGGRNGRDAGPSTAALTMVTVRAFAQDDNREAGSECLRSR